MRPGGTPAGRAAGESSAAPPRLLEGKSRILILGCSGSGKSTLARELGPRLGLPVVHLDRHFWNPGWVESSPEAWDARLASLLAGPTWIMDGTYDRTLDRRLRIADAVIFLDLSRWLCRFRILKRIALGFGKTRPDLAENCPEQIDLEFLRWVWTWPRDILPNVERSLAAAGNQVPVIRLTTVQEVEELRAGTSQILNAG